MTNQTATTELMYSCLATDPDLGEIVVMFVQEMPERIEALTTQYDTQNWVELRRLAHQLKGAAGSYGFDQLTPYSARLESALNEKAKESEVFAAYTSLIEACKCLRSGIPQ